MKKEYGLKEFKERKDAKRKSASRSKVLEKKKGPYLSGLIPN